MKLFVLLLVLFLFILWKKNQRRQRMFGDAFFSSNATGDSFAQAQARADQTPVLELMACARCGVHVSKDQMLEDRQGRLVCRQHHG
jgi:hypothetical protein